MTWWRSGSGLNQIVAALPGFDIAVKVRMMRPWLTGLWWLVAGVAGGSALHLLHRPVWQQAAAVVLALALFTATAVSLVPTQASAHDPPGPRRGCSIHRPGR